MYKTSKYTLLKTIKTLEKPSSTQCDWKHPRHFSAMEKPSSTQCYMHLQAIFNPPCLDLTLKKKCTHLTPYVDALYYFHPLSSS